MATDQTSQAEKARAQQLDQHPQAPIGAEQSPSFDVPPQPEAPRETAPVPFSTEHETPVESKELPRIDTDEGGGIADTLEGITKKLRKPKKKKLEDVQFVRDELTKEVEHIMEDGLKDAFRELSPTEAQAFKIKGEETAREIRGLLQGTKVKIKKIFELLLEWLRLLPGINTFFLEQEAKIKADKIIALHERQKALRAHGIERSK